MKIIKTIFLTATLLFAFSCNKDDDIIDAPAKTELNVIVKGTVEGERKTIVVNPQTGETDNGTCFLLDLVDAETGELIGTAEECALESEFLEAGIIVTEFITFFNFNGEGTIVAENSALQIPVANAFFRTSFTPIGQNIIDATSGFEGLKGTTVLNGELDTSQLAIAGILTVNNGYKIELVN